MADAVARRVLVATRKGLFRVERARSGWAVAGVDFLGDNCSAVLADPRDGTLHVALDHGHFGPKLQRSRDGGATFEETPAPAYPERGEGEAPWVDAFGRTIPDSLRLVWTLEAGPPERPGEIWCGTVPGALFRSADGGSSWSLVEALWNAPDRRRWVGGGMDYPGIHTVSFHPERPATLAVAVSSGGVWLSDDAGASWRVGGRGLRAEYVPPEQAGDPVMQDVHRIARCRARPEVVWLQHHNGIFRSTDGGEHFDEIAGVEPSVFGFAVAAHPHDPDTAWFVPAIKDERRTTVGGRFVVTRTRDGGNAFETLSAGLPQVHAYDLVYRHALDVDATGERLVLGSTTGSMFVSEDGGASWTCVSTHLPPIYALRFVAD